ncbi:DUF2878 domain-containing protein [Candidatus Magnetomoraceae bacterium gMMP-15]
MIYYLIKQRYKMAIRMTSGYKIFLNCIAAIYMLSMILIFYEKPVLLTFLLCGSIVFQLLFFNEKVDIAMMLTAAFLGSFAEIVCVKLNVWTYNVPGLMFGIPIWLPFAWGSLLCLFRRISLHIYLMISNKCDKKNKIIMQIFWGLLAGMIIIYYVIIICVISPTIAIIYTIFMISAVIFWHEKRDMLIFIISAFVGTLGEYICIKFEFWHYHYPLLDSIGLPISLPMAWGLSSVIMGRIANIWDTKRRYADSKS